MRRPKKDIQLTSYDELLGLEETPEKSMNQVVEIDLAKLYPFKNHPFHVNDDEKMAETVESIKTYGVLTPALVRPRPDGGYEMISGHRRKRGCELCFIFQQFHRINSRQRPIGFLFPQIGRASCRERV